MRTINLLIFFFVSLPSMAQLSIAYDRHQAPVAYAVGQLQEELARNSKSLSLYSLRELTEVPDIAVCIGAGVPACLSPYVETADFEDIHTEGYWFQSVNEGTTLLILARDEVGAMYGLLELKESIQAQRSYQIPANKLVNPSLEYRIVKFNLPWSPYRDSEAMSVHMQTCRDLTFWKEYLDMMAENRLNVLSLWNKHPFPYMIRATNFPRATAFSDAEMAEWQHFWKSLFNLAKQRGIQTFIVNWNIVVSPEFAAAYGAKEYNDLSDQVARYTRESVTQVINEYEDLTGIGVTLADWMGNFEAVEMDPQKREDWIENTFVAGINAADRPVKFLHRSVLAGDPMAMRKVIDDANLPDPALVEIKFNWSHGHSTPKLAITHDYHSGKLDERFWSPKPDNYHIQWMIRNEDFFILRWGSPDFIRRHIATNQQDYVNGYFIGSEGYIPAVDYSHKPASVKTWQYAFEKQWLFYSVWGRLLYDAETPDEVFEAAFDARYGAGVGPSLLEAFELASNMPLRLASFHRSTWDYTLYAEGFLAPAPSSPDGFFDKSSPFISIEELIRHETLDPQMLSIPDFVQQELTETKTPSDLITPLALADASEQDSRRALELVNTLRPRVHDFSGALASELDDVATWGHLGLYFADKLRAGVALETFRQTGKPVHKQKAIDLLETCIGHWDQVVALTEDRYMPVPHVSTQRYGDKFTSFSWAQFRKEVQRDVELAKAVVKKK